MKLEHQKIRLNPLKIIPGSATAYTTNSGEPHGGDAYIFVVGFFFVFVLLISLTYINSYICKRSRPPPPPPPPPAFTFRTTTDDETDSHRLVRLSHGVDDDVLVTFPTFLYSDTMMSDKGDAVNDVSCSICLADYKPADVVRLLPACGHMYHLSCIDTWLKSHSTCPMCRNSQVLEANGVTSS